MGDIENGRTYFHFQILNENLAGQTTNEDTEKEDNPEEEVISLKGSSAPEESADTMGAPNLNPKESPEVEGVLNTSQGSLLEVNPEGRAASLRLRRVR